MSNLLLQKNDRGNYHAIFINNHGRILYIEIMFIEDFAVISDCEYIDRSKKSIPQKMTTHACVRGELLDLIACQLDKRFDSVDFLEYILLSKDSLISNFLSSRKKKTLIMLADGNILRTIFKSKVRREIYLELSVDNKGVATITQCCYVDKRAKGLKIPPQGIVTVRFEFSLNKLLRVINEELVGGFSDVMLTREHTIVLDRPICGSI